LAASTTRKMRRIEPDTRVIIKHASFKGKIGIVSHRENYEKGTWWVKVERFSGHFWFFENELTVIGCPHRRRQWNPNMK
jgi:hypothetical protein